MLLKWTTSLLSSSLLSAGLSQPALAWDAFPASKPESRAIWKNRDLLLHTDQLGQAQQLQGTDYLVGVQLPLAFPPELTLWQDPYPPPLLQLQGASSELLVFPVHSLQHLDFLASQIHQETHYCGHLQVFTLQDSLQSELQIVPPVYAANALFQALPNILQQIDIDAIKSTIETLSSLDTRHYSTAETASLTVQEQMQAAASGHSSATISLVQHDIGEQPSVVVRIPGQKAGSDDDAKVIVGAHLDTIARPSDDAPGADDDATGVAILVELLRQITAQQLVFERSIELHAYGVEEIGLIGSRDLAVQAQSQSLRTAAMMQIDMTGWSSEANDPTIFLVDHDTSRDLRRQAMQWMHHYFQSDFALGELPIGATSDHKSWYDRGFATLFAFEDPDNYNPHIHTRSDTFDKLNNFTLTRRIAQLALTFLSYQAGLSSLQDEYASQAQQLFQDTENELFLAILDQSEGEGLMVSAPAATQVVEICQIEDASSSGCQAMRFAFETQESRGIRRIFSSLREWSLQAGQRFRVEAYDESQKLVAIRQIEILD